MAEINVIKLGMVNTFVISDDGYILVDVGMKRSVSKILKGLAELKIDPKELKLIVLTHNHDDHIGGLKALKELSGAPVVMHELDYKCLMKEEEYEIKPLSLLVKIIFAITKNMEAAPFDIHIEHLMKESFDLTEYGVKGRLIHTPGHSKGSISVLLDDGQTIIGDSLMAMMPWSKPKGPILAYDLPELKKSMNKLIEEGAKRFYLSHGDAYDKSLIQKVIESI